MKKHTAKGKLSQATMHANFVQAFISNGENATQAYLKVKPHVAVTTAGVEGHRLLKIPKIHAAIEAYRTKLRSRFALTTDRVIQELARIAYFDPRGVLDASGAARALHQIDDDTAAGLTIELDGAGKVVRMRTPPQNAKNAAVRMAAKILRLEDKPPPPPPDADTGEIRYEDPRETARRMAFLLAKGKAETLKHEPKVARAAKKKAPLAA